MFDLTGRTALVTGASGGLGGAIAKALHAQGAKVALSGTQSEALEKLTVNSGNGRTRLPAISPIPLWPMPHSRCRGQVGSLDIVVNNAGVTRDSLFVRMKDEDWDSVIEMNLSAAFRLTRAALKGMMRRWMAA